MIVTVVYIYIYGFVKCRLTQRLAKQSTDLDRTFAGGQLPQPNYDCSIHGSPKILDCYPLVTGSSASSGYPLLRPQSLPTLHCRGPFRSRCATQQRQGRDSGLVTSRCVSTCLWPGRPCRSLKSKAGSKANSMDDQMS